MYFPLLTMASSLLLPDLSFRPLLVYSAARRGTFIKDTLTFCRRHLRVVPGMINRLAMECEGSESGC